MSNFAFKKINFILIGLSMVLVIIGFAQAGIVMKAGQIARSAVGG